MTTTLAPARPLVRRATPDDNAALIELAAACPMEGDLALRIDRAPDFFALNRLQGGRWAVGIVDGENERPIACVATAERRAWVHGRPATIIYAGDLKVHPGHRTTRAADALERFVSDVARDAAGEATPVLLTVLAGNAAMERRTAGPRGLPKLHRFATLHSFAVPLLWRRRPDAATHLHVGSATDADIEEMADLWGKVAPARQFATAFDAEELRRWIANAPGLSIDDYLIARDRRGRLIAFAAMWDQRDLKTLRVLRYSPGLSALRHIVSAIAPLVGATPPPPVGHPLHYASAVHVCVPVDRPDAMRALVLSAYQRLHRTDRVFLSITLDARDPLTEAMRGLLAAPTPIHAYATQPCGTWRGGALDDRPLHFETALV
jgi:hypothetical protein